VIPFLIVNKSENFHREHVTLMINFRLIASFDVTQLFINADCCRNNYLDDLLSNSYVYIYYTFHMGELVCSNTQDTSHVGNTTMINCNDFVILTYIYI
jgi:hypothetical protein